MLQNELRYGLQTEASWSIKEKLKIQKYCCPFMQATTEICFGSHKSTHVCTTCLRGHHLKKKIQNKTNKITFKCADHLKNKQTRPEENLNSKTHLWPTVVLLWNERCIIINNIQCKIICIFFKMPFYLQCKTVGNNGSTLQCQRNNYLL